MSGATYRELMERAARQLEEARGSTCVRFDDRASALAAVADQHSVLSAVASHIWAVLTPGRAAGVRAAPYPDSTEAAAIRLAVAISEAVGGSDPYPAMLDGPHAAWGRSARTLRAATDLFVVHHDASGAPRSPDARTLESLTVRDAALSHLGALTLTVTSTRSALELRLGQAGVPWSSVLAHLPQLERVEDAGRKLAALLPLRDEARLPDVSLLPTDIRTGDVVEELAARLLRVRQRSWELPTSPDRSIATLRDLAVLGVAVHAHTAAFHGLSSTTAHLVDAARRWQKLCVPLAMLRSSGPPDELVRADLTAAAGLLSTIAPLAGQSRASAPNPQSRRAGATLNGAVRLMTDVADQSSRAFTAIARTGAVYVPARTLTGDDVTDHPELVRAHLEGIPVRAPQRMLTHVGELYVALRAHLTHEPVRLAPLPASHRVIDASPSPVGHSAVGWPRPGRRSTEQPSRPWR
ncbi:hypothetical protein [Cellulomonas cellasea]|uniref:Uncharacterized protein n=1 Tax=Cellulomonas cellasea TaxID=43670 RepID=A0A7W4UBT4_9CELL|nr:hypothetical protein [Cellulomonas cellasea]MBB2921276.1 hypothetical protein [Cellulomonas cellasea]